MKLATFAWVTLAIAARLPGNNANSRVSIINETAEDEIRNHEPRTLDNIIDSEQRFVLFYSRRLEEKCLSVCMTQAPTSTPLELNPGSGSGSPHLTVAPSEEPTGDASGSDIWKPSPATKRGRATKKDEPFAP
eukprot:jgi/Psemu1/316099/fgenesh1_kg.2771_\